MDYSGDTPHADTPHADTSHADTSHADTSHADAPPADASHANLSHRRTEARLSEGKRQRPATAAAALLTVAIATLSATAARGQQDQVLNLELFGRADKAITVALPNFSVLAGAEGEANILHQVLRADLDYSMVFEIVDPEFYPELEGGDSTPDFAAWRRTGAEALIRAFVRREGDGIVAQFRLYDVQSGGQIIGKQYSDSIPIAETNLTNTKLRKIAHQFNDEAVLYYTGIPGVAATRITYVGNRRGPKEIYVMDYDGYGNRRITNDGGLALNPAFSPSGNQIAYVSYRVHDGIPNVDIAMLNQGGGVPPVVVRTEGQDSGPAWSPDGTRLAFSSTKDGMGNANSEIYMSKPDGSDMQRLTTNSEIDASPTFSPNGREIAFISTRAGGQHLYKMGIDGTNLRRLRVSGTQIDSPAWNPNPQFSDLIAYTASEGGNRFQIFVYSLTTNSSARVTQGYGRADSPSWSPDGRQIVFEAAQGSDTHIYAVGIDGSRLRQLTRDGSNQSPSWGGR